MDEEVSQRMHRQFLYLSETTRLIRHLAALAKQYKVRYENSYEGRPNSVRDLQRGAYDASCTALGAALLDDKGQHHYTFQEAQETGYEWLHANEDQITV